MRVPVYNAHSESVNVQTREDLSPERCREVLARSRAWSCVDEPAAGRYPMPIDAAGRDDVFVGRIRRDPSHERCLNMWVVSDNLRKGAATNAVQLAELLRRARPRPGPRARGGIDSGRCSMVGKAVLLFGAAHRGRSALPLAAPASRAAGVTTSGCGSRASDRNTCLEPG